MATVANDPTSNNLVHDKGDTALVRGIRTALQAVIGAVAGLLTTVWGVPGVPEAVVNYVTNNIGALALALGIPAGIAAFVWNLFRKNVKNW